MQNRHRTIEEVARDRWGCSDDLVRDRIKDGSLPAINIGTDRRPLWRIDETALQRFEDERRAEKPEPKPVNRQARRKKLPPNIRKFV